MRWPRSLKRASLSPVPRKTTTATASAAACKYRRGEICPPEVEDFISSPRSHMRRSAQWRGCGNSDDHGVRHQGDDSSEYHDDQANPDPGHQWIQVCLDDRASGGVVLTFVNQIEIAYQKKVLAEAGVNSRQRLRLSAGFIKPAFGKHSRNLLAVPEYMNDRPLVAVVRIVILRVGLADQRVGAYGNLVAEAHFFFAFAIKGSPENSDDAERDPEVNNVAAIAARVAVA